MCLAGATAAVHHCLKVAEGAVPEGARRAGHGKALAACAGDVLGAAPGVGVEAVGGALQEAGQKGGVRLMCR